MSDDLEVPANDNSRRRVTLEAIEQNPWNAVDGDLPEDADRSLLERAAFAAGKCSKAALAAARVAEITEPELAPFYLSSSTEAVDRRDEARRRLGQLAPERISKVSPFLDPSEVQEKALRSIMVDVAEARPPRAPITAAEIEKNPWSIVRNSLSGAGPELLARVCDTAVGLMAEALERSDSGVYSREASALWKSYAEAAGNTYIDAYQTLRANVRGPLGIENGPELLTRQSIARNAQNAVELDIPADGSRDLLSVIVETAADLRETFNKQAQLSLREEDAAEFRDLSGEARRRQQEAEARLDCLDGGRQRAPEQRPVEPPDGTDPLRDSDQAALIDMLGDAAYRAVNEPVPRGTDALTLERLSADLDAALDRLDALMRSPEGTGISLLYIAAQFAKAGARQEEVGTRLERMDVAGPGSYRGPIEHDRTAGDGPPDGAWPAKSDDAFTEELLEGLRYTKLCEDAYQRHLEFLTLPAPRSASENTALEIFFKGFQQEFDFRPEIRLAPRETLEAAAAGTAPEQSPRLAGEPERGPQTVIEPSGADRNFPAGGLIAGLVGERLARAVDLVRERVSDLFAAAPTPIPQDMRQMRESIDGVEVVSEGEVTLTSAGNAALVADRTLASAAVEPEKDLYLSTVLEATSIAEPQGIGRDQAVREPERDRGRHL